MRHGISQVFRAILITLPLVSAASVQAQDRRPSAEQEPEASPITTFDLESALVSSSGGLTSEAVAEKARARAPAAKSAEAAALSAEYDTQGSWNSLLPVLTFTGQYKRVNLVKNNIGGDPAIFNALNMRADAITDPASRDVTKALLLGFASPASFTQPVNQYVLAANLRVPVSDMLLRFWPAYEGSRTVAEARKLQAQAAAENAELQGRRAFYSYANAVSQRTLQEQAVRQAEASAAQTKLFVNAGTKAPVELMTANAEVEKQRGTLAQILGSEAIARAQVSILSGMPESEIQAIAEPITQLPEVPGQSLDDLVGHGVEHRTELLALRKLVGAGEAVHRSEKNAAYPQFYLDGNALYANPNQRYIPIQKKFNPSWDVSANIAWSPNQSLQGYTRGKRTGADLAKARADLQTLEDGVRTEVVTAFNNLQSAIAVAHASEAGVKAAEEAYRVRLATYRVGAGVLLDLTQADQNVTIARSTYVNSVIGARLALAELRRSAALQ
jgi:outer membrane protein